MQLDDGRTLRGYDTGGAADDGVTVLWHHGSPQTGAPLEPLLLAAAQRNIRLVTYARPSCGGSSPSIGRTVASAANDVRQLADTLGLGRFAVMGASGGGPHALACAALLGDRVTGVVSIAGLAPFTDERWFDGMVAPGGLRSALRGRDARARFAETEEFDLRSFTAADWAALAGGWAALADDAGTADAAGPDGLIDDDVAFVSPWGCDLSLITAPLLITQGGRDRVVPPSHADLLARHCPAAELLLRPDDGHISILETCTPAMDWLRDHAAA